MRRIKSIMNVKTQATNMTEIERKLLIDMLVLFTNKTESYFIYMPDAELEQEYDRLMNKG